MTTKPKHLTLRASEVARFLRPSGLVILPFTPPPTEVRIQGGDWLACDGRILTYPLGGPGTKWVGREAFIPCQSIGFPCKPSEASYVCFRDGEQHYRNGKHSKWTLKDPPNWKAERHVFLPARRMPDWASRIRKTTTRVELRRVRTITEAEAVEAGFDGQQHNLGHGNIGETTPSETFADDFNARYPDAWDRDDYCWFVFYTDTLGKD